MPTPRREGPSSGAKLRVLRRDGYKCTYCGAPGSDSELEIDHIIPVSRGGSHHIANLTTACRKCNQTKSNKTDFKKPIRSCAVNDSIVGLYVHILEGGEPINQGVIVGHIASADAYAIKRFSFMDGRETDVIFVKTSRLIDGESVKIYANPIEMHRHFAGWQRFGKLTSFIDPDIESFLIEAFPEYYNND